MIAQANNKILKVFNYVKYSGINLTFVILILTAILIVSNESSAANLTQTTPGNFINSIIKDKNAKIRYHLIFVGTSWCGYCRKAIPKFLELEELYKGELRVMFLSIDDNVDQATTFSEHIKTNDEDKVYYFEDIHDVADIFNFFHVRYKDSIPHIILIKKDDRHPVMDGNVSASAVNQYLEKHLK